MSISIVSNSCLLFVQVCLEDKCILTAGYEQAVKEMLWVGIEMKISVVVTREWVLI